MSKNKNELYFAYGSNLDIDQMQQKCDLHPNFLSIGYLPEHRLAFTQYFEPWGGGIADVVKDQKSNVWGILYELSAESLERLDNHEGYYGEDPSDYTRNQYTIITPAGQQYIAWVYTLKRKGGKFVAPSQRYMNIIKRAAKTYGFPESYLSFLDSITPVDSMAADTRS